MWVAQGCGENAHVGEVKFAAGCAGRGRGELVAQGVEMVDRGSVRHAAILGDGTGFGGRWLRPGDGKAWCITRQFGAYHEGGISRVVQTTDSKESTVATCNVLHVWLPVQPWRKL